MQEILLARQPIVDRQESLYAFELLFRSVKTEGALDNTHATAKVVVNAFEEMGIAKVLGSCKGFINLDTEFLYSDLLALLPRQQVVLELLESIAIDDAIIARCRELKAQGFSLALDDVVELSARMIPLLDVVDVVKLDLLKIKPDQLPLLVKEFKRYPVKLLAEKVEDPEQARRCLEMGFDMFQGYHFAHPELLSGKSVHPSKVVLLRILALMLSDAPDDKIEEAFKEYADLVYSLMRMVNSVGTGLTTRVSSIKHGLMVLGRKPLQRWVQLLLYASGKGEHKISPLMQLAATRGKMMELLAQQVRKGDQEYADRAFMVGSLSLLDALLGLPLPDVLARLSLHVEAEVAMLGRGGQLGGLLDLCETLEKGNTALVYQRLPAYPGLTVGGLVKAELDAMAWANSITI